MVLYRLKDFDSEYQDAVGHDDIVGLDVYTDRDDEKVGSVKGILVDEAGRFRYLVVDTGFWIFGKQVLLPVGRTRVFPNSKRVYALGFTKEQAEQLPKFSDDLKIDENYEEQVRGVYRTQSVDASIPLEASAPLDTPTAYKAPATTPVPPVPATNVNYVRDTYTYEQEPHLYEMNDPDQQTLKLYEERLVANKNRRQTGEVSIGKHVETETQQVSIPIEKERVVVERVTPADASTPVSPTNAFREGEVARVQISEETPDIRKETVVGEEVRIRKEVERDTVEAQETIRRERLDINTQNPSDVDRI